MFQQALTVDTPVTNAAIPATIMTILGDESTFPGPPLNALWTTPPPGGVWPNPVSEVSENKYLAQRDRPADPSVPTVVTGAMKSVVSGPWQLITHQRAGKQLYDWKLDPGETNNRIGAPEGKADIHRHRIVGRQRDSAVPTLSRYRRIPASRAGSLKIQLQPECPCPRSLHTRGLQ